MEGDKVDGNDGRLWLSERLEWRRLVMEWEFMMSEWVEEWRREERVKSKTKTLTQSLND
jgi:hypothetical protein